MAGKSPGTNKYLLTCITGGRNIIFVPGLGEKIFFTVPEDEAVVYIDALLRAYRRLGRTGGRIRANPCPRRAGAFCRGNPDESGTDTSGSGELKSIPMKEQGIGPTEQR